MIQDNFDGPKLFRKQSCVHRYVTTINVTKYLPNLLQILSNSKCLNDKLIKILYIFDKNF